LNNFEKIKELLTEIEKESPHINESNKYEILSKIGKLNTLIQEVDSNIADIELRNNIHDSGSAVIFNAIINYVNSLRGKPQNQISTELEMVLVFLGMAYNLAYNSDLKRNIKDTGDEIARNIDSKFNPDNISSHISYKNSKKRYFSYLSHPLVLLVILSLVCSLIYSFISGQTSWINILTIAGFALFLVICIVIPIIQVILWIISFLSSITKPPF
jgi:hypothetical protein